MIDVQHFCKSYDDSIAVKDLCFKVGSGQVLGLIGRNGAGKTTTLRALTGIVRPSAGSLSVDGFSLTDSPIELKRRTAYVPDDPQLFSDLSVEQHLKFQASVYGISDPTEHIADLLDAFNLETKRHAAASALSRGMRQKLAICCAYLQKPKALLLDEPMTGLDPQAIRVLKNTIVKQAESGVAVIISSHLLAMVEGICSHVLVLNKGKCKFFGRMPDLQKQFSTDPKTTSTLEEAFFSALSEVEDTLEKEISSQGVRIEPETSVSLNSSLDSVS